MRYTIQDIFLMFFIYGFLGWCLEIAFCGIKEGHFVNRGFLNGPICPIYGVGGAVVILCLTPLKKNIILLYIFSVILTSVLEFLTGYVLEKIYHVRWWDYTEEKFNLRGYICLKFSLAWGIVCTALMYFIQPVIYESLIYKIPSVVKTIFVIVFGVIIIIDLIATINTLKHLRMRLKKIDEIGKRLHELSEELGENIYERAERIDGLQDKFSEDERIRKLISEAKERREESEQIIEDMKDKIKDELNERRVESEKRFAELRDKYEKQLAERKLLQNRILKSFPKMRSERYNEALRKLREKIR